jgi:hypothetical protein
MVSEEKESDNDQTAEKEVFTASLVRLSPRTLPVGAFKAFREAFEVRPPQ